MRRETEATCDVAVVGGCGRAGMPLCVALANAGLSVVGVDRDERAVDLAETGRFPFREERGDEQLKLARASGRLRFTTRPDAVGMADAVVIVIGTPVGDGLEADPKILLAALGVLLSYLCLGQLVVLRSAVCVGVTAAVEAILDPLGIDVVTCPERTAEGRALVELPVLPQIVGARTSGALARASDLFGAVVGEIVAVSPEEAELAKLFTNTWRYVRFAAANQFFMVANDLGIDFERVRIAMTHRYPRAADIPPAGLASGPCLLKDTLQLAGSHPSEVVLAAASMAVNEGLPAYLVGRAEARWPLAECTVGILGMSFKAESDDVRSSLAQELRRLLEVRAARVLCTDPYVTVDPTLVPMEVVLAEADVLFIGAPHAVYRMEDLAERDVVDVWNLLARGVLT